MGPGGYQKQCVQMVDDMREYEFGNTVRIPAPRTLRSTDGEAPLTSWAQSA